MFAAILENSTGLNVVKLKIKIKIKWIKGSFIPKKISWQNDLRNNYNGKLVLCIECRLFIFLVVVRTPFKTLTHGTLVNCSLKRWMFY